MHGMGRDILPVDSSVHAYASKLQFLVLLNGVNLWVLLLMKIIIFQKKDSSVHARDTNFSSIMSCVNFVGIHDCYGR